MPCVWTLSDGMGLVNCFVECLAYWNPGPIYPSKYIFPYRYGVFFVGTISQKLIQSTKILSFQEEASNMMMASVKSFKHFAGHKHFISVYLLLQASHWAAFKKDKACTVSAVSALSACSVVRNCLSKLLRKAYLCRTGDDGKTTYKNSNPGTCIWKKWSPRKSGNI